MIVILLAIISFLLFSTLATIIILVARARSSVRQIKSAFADFFVEVDKDGVSQFGHFVNNLSEVAAVRIGQNVRAGINGSIGGMTKGVVAELEQAGAESSPDLALMSALPRSLRKNNLAMAGLQWFLNNKLGNLGNKPGSSSGSNGSGGQASFNL